VRKRVEELLKRLARMATQPEPMRRRRAVEVLEYIGTPAARRLLKKLAGGAADADQTKDAKASLRRLALPAIHGGFFRLVALTGRPSNFRASLRTRCSQRRAAADWRFVAFSPG
jgi:hypothetical protein